MTFAGDGALRNPRVGSKLYLDPTLAIGLRVNSLETGSVFGDDLPPPIPARQHIGPHRATT